MSKPKSKSATSRIVSPTQSALDAFVCRPDIQALVTALREGIKEPDNKLIALAATFNELRKNFEAQRHALNLTWYEWGRRYLNYDKNKMALVSRLADAKDRNEQQRILDKNRLHRRDGKRNERQRDKSTEAQLTENHKRMRKLIPKLSAEEAKAEYLRLWQRYSNRI